VVLLTLAHSVIFPYSELVNSHVEWCLWHSRMCYSLDFIVPPDMSTLCALSKMSLRKKRAQVGTAFMEC